ncbi:hypothetical protein LXA43DRAFT_1059924 [Ganoderma leucocontextum]|nr:hypothetical protein LXA43DRAFT_1059924 [Ganoderma leucocontextum]
MSEPRSCLRPWPLSQFLLCTDSNCGSYVMLLLATTVAVDMARLRDAGASIVQTVDESMPVAQPLELEGEAPLQSTWTYLELPPYDRQWPPEWPQGDAEPETELWKKGFCDNGEHLESGEGKSRMVNKPQVRRTRWDVRRAASQNIELHREMKKHSERWVHTALRVPVEGLARLGPHSRTERARWKLGGPGARLDGETVPWGAGSVRSLDVFIKSRARLGQTGGAVDVPPTATSASESTKKHHCCESDIDGAASMPSDTDSNTPGEEPPCPSTAKQAKATSITNKAAPKDTSMHGDHHASMTTEDADKSNSTQDSATGPAPASSTIGSAQRAARLEERCLHGEMDVPVYKHFRAPVLFTRPNGSITIHFVCDRSPSKHNHHVGKCKPAKTGNTELIFKYAQGANYSYTRVYFLLAMWITHHHHPFTIVEDPEFQELLRMLYGRVKISSRVMVSRDLKEIIEDSHEKVKEKLQVLAITCDNTSNNAKMMKDLKALELDFRGSEARVHCFSHVINLVMKVLGAFIMLVLIT